MKKSIWSMIIFAISLCLFISVSGADNTSKGKAEKSTVNYLARVNGVEIYPLDLERKLNIIKNRYAKIEIPIDNLQMIEFKDIILKSLIEQEILFQEANAQGIKIDPRDIQTELDDFKKQFETEAAFQKQISAINYTEDLLLSRIRHFKTRQKFIEEKIMPTIKVSDDEVRDYFDTHPDEFNVPERVRASHIMLKVDPKASEVSKTESLKKMEAIKSKLDNGEDFAKLAGINSDCPSRDKGGDLGFLSRDPRMDKLFEDTVFALNAGEVSGVVETQLGYHIIKSNEKQIATTLSYDDIKEKLMEKLKEYKLMERLQLNIESLKEKYKIEIFTSSNNNNE